MGLVLGKQTHGRNFRLSKCHREDFSSLLHAYQELPRTDTDKHLFNSFYHGVCYEILLFSSISLHWLLRKAFLSPLAILWNSAFRCLYLTFSPLLFASLLFTAICIPTEWERLEISLRKSEIPMEHFMQRWAR